MAAVAGPTTSASDAARSVFRYVDRTAEHTAEGVRWQTLSYGNRPQYEADVFNGVAGIPLFLADYYRATGERRALELALGGAEWCSAPGRSFSGDGPSGWPAPESLCFGRAGVSLAWLRLAQVTGDSALLLRAAGSADRLLEAEPGPVTDFLGGAAGEGIFLIRLWRATGDPRHLAGAVRRARWLEGHALRDGGGKGDDCRWHVQIGAPRPATFVGFAHGVTGIGYFLLLLHEATRDDRWAVLARAVARTVDRQAVPHHGGLNWPLLPVPEDHPVDARALPCQWCHGSPGVGLFFAKAHQVLGDPSYLSTARAAGETTFACGDNRQNPSLCHGLAGNAQLFLELYRVTRDPSWLDRAHDFAARALAYRTAGPDGDTWQADEPGYSSPDFLCGAAGTGQFFLRLEDPLTVGMPLL